MPIKEKIANTFVSAILNSNGAPWGIRTLDLWFRRPTLYPAELMAHIKRNNW